MEIEDRCSVVMLFADKSRLMLSLMWSCSFEPIVPSFWLKENIINKNNIESHQTLMDKKSFFQTFSKKVRVRVLCSLQEKISVLRFGSFYRKSRGSGVRFDWVRFGLEVRFGTQTRP